MENPWAVDSLQKFAKIYYCCPECENKCQTKQDFIQHAFENHPQGAISLYGIQDKDVELPDDPLKKEEIIKGILFLETFKKIESLLFLY